MGESITRQSWALCSCIETSLANFLLYSIAQHKPESEICYLVHSVSNLVIQAAFTLGIEIRGIELMEAWYNVAKILCDHFQEHFPVCSYTVHCPIIKPPFLTSIIPFPEALQRKCLPNNGQHNWPSKPSLPDTQCLHPILQSLKWYHEHSVGAKEQALLCQWLYCRISHSTQVGCKINHVA